MGVHLKAHSVGDGKWLVPHLKESTWIRPLLRVVAVILSVLIFLALLRALRDNWPAAAAAWRDADINPVWITIAVALGLAALAITAFGWWRLLVDCGVSISLWQTIRIYIVSHLGKYLPAGKAFEASIVAVMAAGYKLPVTTLVATSVVVGVVGMATGIALALPMGDTTLAINDFWILIPLAATIALIAAPAALKSLPRLRKVIVRRLKRVDSITTGTMLMLVWTTAASWVVWGLALNALANGLLAKNGVSAVTYIAAWIGSFMAGAIAVVTPAGLGVRDEIMRNILTASGLSTGSAIVVIVVARIWTTVLDVIPALAFLVFRKRKH